MQSSVENLTLQSTTPVYPVGLDLTDKTILVVGAGQVALRKLKRLLQLPCNLVVVTTNVTDGVADFMRDFSPKPGVDTHSIYYEIPETYNAKSFLIEKKWYSFELLEYHQPHLVLACTNDEETNRLIVTHAQRLGIWVNNVTHQHTPADMVIGAVEELQGLQLALFSQYQTPVFTKWVKEKIQAALPQGLGKISQALGLLRPQLQQQLPEQSQREAFLRSLLANPQWVDLAQLEDKTAEDLTHAALLLLNEN